MDHNNRFPHRVGTIRVPLWTGPYPEPLQWSCSVAPTQQQCVVQSNHRAIPVLWRPTVVREGEERSAMHHLCAFIIAPISSLGLWATVSLLLDILQTCSFEEDQLFRRVMSWTERIIMQVRSRKIWREFSHANINMVVLIMHRYAADIIINNVFLSYRHTSRRYIISIIYIKIIGYCLIRPTWMAVLKWC